jgi:KDO2-lipid IV(A) lauroyltransferase
MPVSKNSCDPESAQHFWALKFWPTWVLLGLLKFISMLPFAWQVALAKTLTPIVMMLAKSRVKVCRINLEKAFPDWTPEHRAVKLRECFYSFVLGAIESNFTYWASRENFLKLPIRIDGFEYVQAALSKGQGVIICGYHLHLIDLASRAVGEKLKAEGGVKTAAVYQANKNPLVDKFLYGWRRRYAADVFRRKELKKMLSWLKNGNVLLYAPDQDFGRAPSVFAPFFNIPTATITAPARMVQHVGSVLVPVIFLREAGQYLIRFHKPIDHYPSGDDLKDASALNALFESVIREYPEQYLWQHRRFKTRPEGEESFYE